jgi:hypothetical protein
MWRGNVARTIRLIARRSRSTMLLRYLTDLDIRIVVGVMITAVLAPLQLDF